MTVLIVAKSDFGLRSKGDSSSFSDVLYIRPYFENTSLYEIVREAHDHICVNPKLYHIIIL